MKKYFYALKESFRLCFNSSKAMTLGYVIIKILLIVLPSLQILLLSKLINQIESVDKLSKASAVFQNYSKYKLSLKSNITIGEELKRSDDCLRSQLEKIQLNQRECTLDTVLSSEFDGIDLSKGQWQKVAILRGQRDAFNLLVLDEPTSSIDPLQEADVIHYFETMSQNSTLILVTHRLNAIRFVHRIFVLDEGVIVEDGTHVELMEKQGLYYQMYSEQRDKYDLKL